MSKYSLEFQIMRGIAILMVLIHHSMSHIPPTYNTQKIILSLNHVHVVVFFIIAGMLFEAKKDKIFWDKNFCISKTKRLMIPYLFWSFFLAFGIKLACKVPGIADLLESFGYYEWPVWKIILNIFTMKEYYTAHLWFIYVLFLFYLINYWFKDSFSNWRVVLAFFLVVNLLFDLAQPPFLLDKILKHFINFSVGRMIIRYNCLERINDIRITALAMLSILCLSVMEYFVTDSWSYTYVGNTLWGIAGTQLIFVMSCVIKEKSPWVLKKLKLVGDNSYCIYLIHNPYIVSGIYVVFNIMGLPRNFLYVVLSVVSSVVIPILIYKIISSHLLFRNVKMIMFGS